MGTQPPTLDPYSWRSCLIGDYFLPPKPNAGAVTIKAKSKQKIDQKKASGKDKAATTQQGRESVDITIDFHFIASAWEDSDVAGVETILAAIDPNGKAYGGPFSFSHVDTDRRGVKRVMIKQVGEVSWKGAIGHVTIEAEEWTEEKKAADSKATKTPDEEPEPDEQKPNPGGAQGGAAAAAAKAVADAGKKAAKQDPYNKQPASPSTKPK